jgi:murein DD-endopeptidase MepM/ murein hydrolase activator NlpD
LPARSASYGLVVILDHGGGWSSVITNLAALGVGTGQQVARGVPVGRAGGDSPQLTVELRYQGRPVPITALLAADVHPRLFSPPRNGVQGPEPHHIG